MINAAPDALSKLNGLVILAGLLVGSWEFLSCRPAVAADGIWKERTEEIYVPSLRNNVRKTFRVWDFHPELKLQFSWEPDIAGDQSLPPEGIVDAGGKGTLTWIPQGSGDNNNKDFYSRYVGELKNGRAEGVGSLSMRSGTTYVGSWHDGLMNGRGALKLENGDEYDGEFEAGRMNGRGRYGSADGKVYTGEFRNDSRNGIGTLTIADGTSYRITSRDAVEESREIIAGDSTPAAVGRLNSPLALRVLIDRKKSQEVMSTDNFGFPYYVYEATIEPGLINIQLASQPIMAVWKGTSIIQRPWQIDDSAYFPPLFLLANITNEGKDASVRVTNSYLEIEKSVSDLLPYLQTIGGHQTSCTGGDDNTDGHYDASVLFKNLGWGSVRNAKIVYSFGDDRSKFPEFTTTLGTFADAGTTSLDDGLEKLNVNIGALRRNKFSCKSESRVPACLKQVESTGVLGKLAGHVFTDGYKVQVKVRGRVDFEWTSIDGKNNLHSAPVSTDIPLFYLGNIGPECGMAPVDRSGKPVELSVDRQNYRIPLDWRGELAKGENARFALSIVAPKSSEHAFRMVLELADGNKVTSLPINVTYFKPRL